MLHKQQRHSVVELPQWPGRAWAPVFDSSKVAPFDALVADEELSEAEVREARLAGAMWGGGGFFPLLPWSCAVLESVPAESLVAARSRAAGAAAAGAGAGGAAAGAAADEGARAAEAAARRQPTPEQMFAEVDPPKQQ